MKILVVHNAYQHQGGEDAVMEAEVALLTRHGHGVEVFLRHNDALHLMSYATAAMHTLWSVPVAREFDECLRTFQPDVVHVHNTFPLISPAIYWVADRRHIPVVQTLHNFRLACPQAMFLRQGKVCEDCVGKVPWRSILHGCYRQSRMQSAMLAGMVTLHRVIHTWDTKVTRYIALNDFCRDKFIESGLPPERVVVKPNFVDFPAPEMGQRSGFLFVGRLSAEKGIDVLVKAVSMLEGVALRVAGTGPQAHLLEGVAGLSHLGALSGDNIRHEMAGATALILPSICYENCPRTLVEAFGCGLPVIASKMGALVELVQEGVTGLFFEPGNSVDLSEKIRWASKNPEKMAVFGRNARAKYEAEYTAEKNYQQLMAIYQDAIASVLVV